MQTSATQPQSTQTPLHPIFDSQLYRQIEAWLGEQSKVGNSTFFTVEQFPWAIELETHWQVIRDELDQVLSEVETLPSYQDIMPRQQRISPDGKWKTYFFYAFGLVATANCHQCPQTWALIQQVPGLQAAFFSILAPGKHIPEHRGKHKGLIRYHLGLKVPEPAGGCRIRVGNSIQHWAEGESLIFDDTFYHEAWNETDGYRVVLFLDIARPFGWPLNWVNGVAGKLLRFSPLVKQAQENHQQWEEKRRTKSRGGEP